MYHCSREEGQLLLSLRSDESDKFEKQHTTCDYSMLSCAYKAVCDLTHLLFVHLGNSKRHQNQLQKVYLFILFDIHARRVRPFYLGE